MSSVAFLDLRPPPAPPPESSSPPTPPEPPDPPDPQICLSFNVSLAQSPLTTSVPLLLAKSLNSFRVLLLDESLFTNWFGEMFPHNSGLTQSISMGLDILVSTFLLSSSTLIALLRSLTKVCRFCLDLARFEFVSWQFRHTSLFQFIWPADQNLLVFEKRSITEPNTFYKVQFAVKVSCQAPKRFIPILYLLLRRLPCLYLVLRFVPPAFLGPRLSLSLVLPQCEDITCFTDAAWNASSSSCGMGWIFKTQHQRVIHQGSSSRLHTLSALAAEALVIKSVLTAALRMEFNSPPSQFARTLKSSYLCSIQRPQRMSLRGYFMILPVCVFHSYLLNSALFHV
ncbi:unnamed protein product [Arabidopsis thaliana]|uniref:Uncharacterized protein n=1 Tax=Arabidopsis thaliana TaxID=3702 RepID=A0A654EFI9_ARATH|nr:unnamed protein product [Arabidopsis thaliana]